MEDLAELVQESIELELNAAGIYALFHFAFPEDAAFWWQLHIEERNHASMLRSIRETFLPISVYPEGFVLPPLQELKETNRQLQKMLEEFRRQAPGRTEAFHAALAIESSAGEIHLQNFADQPHENKIDRIFSRLIRDDKDHLERIEQYMRARNIPMPEEND